MTQFSYTTEEARRIIADHGLIGRVSAKGAALCIYEGDEDAPGTWLEVDRIAVKSGKVASSALQAVFHGSFM